jgi:Lrp/AsnC family leucine-responsive transcriptional regulator
MQLNNFDNIDIKIISESQSNGDISNLDLAAKVGLSPSPCFRRVKRLQMAGVLKKKVTLVDAQKIGLDVSVFVQVTLADYLLRVVVPDLRAYEFFLKNSLTRFPGVLNIKSSFALNQVKYSTALPLSHLKT